MGLDEAGKSRNVGSGGGMSGMFAVPLCIPALPKDRMKMPMTIRLFQAISRLLLVLSLIPTSLLHPHQAKAVALCMGSRL